MDFLTEIEKKTKMKITSICMCYIWTHFRRFLRIIILNLCSHTTAHRCFFNNSQLTDAGRMSRRFSGAAGLCRYIHVINDLIFDNLWSRLSPPTPTSSPCPLTVWRSGLRSMAPSFRASISPNWDSCQPRKRSLWSDHLNCITSPTFAPILTFLILFGHS